MSPRWSLSQEEAHADTSRSVSRTCTVTRCVPKGRAGSAWLQEGMAGWARPRGPRGVQHLGEGGRVSQQREQHVQSLWGMPCSPGCAAGRGVCTAAPCRASCKGSLPHPHPAPLPSPIPGGGRRTPHPEGRLPGKRIQGAWATPAQTLPRAHQPETWSLSLGAGWEGLEGRVSYLPILFLPGCRGHVGSRRHQDKKLRAPPTPQQ